MNKRGQIYIIAALILSVAIFLLVSQTNFVQRILFEDDFVQISKNYDIESAKFVNTLLSGGEMLIEQVKPKFTTFTEKFTNYAKIENPEFEFIYVLNYKGRSIIENYMDDPITVGNETIDGVGDLYAVASVDDMGTTVFVSSATLVNNTYFGPAMVSSVIIHEMEYQLDFMLDAPQIIIISRAEKDNQTKVFLNEDFITGVKV